MKLSEITKKQFKQVLKNPRVLEVQNAIVKIREEFKSSGFRVVSRWLPEKLGGIYDIRIIAPEYDILQNKNIYKLPGTDNVIDSHIEKEIRDRTNDIIEEEISDPQWLYEGSFVNKKGALIVKFHVWVDKVKWT